MSDMDKNLSRRNFLKTSSASLAALGALGMTGAEKSFAKPAKEKMAMVGTGGRGIGMWGRPLVKDYSDRLEFVGLCDINPDRVKFAASEISPGVPTFTDFDKMIADTKPDRVVVTTVDGLHAEYVARTLAAGCNVICEKPFATEAGLCQKIIDAEKKHNGNVTVTFNARYGNNAMKLKELLMENVIGDIISVSYDEFLDTRHGADYFRRWHGLKKASGTLLCHKASHHFDELNWWIASDPVEVTAYGDLKVYGRNGKFRHGNCRMCTYKDQCRFYWDMTKEDYYMKLYAECEDQDGYFRDGCVYRWGIDIYDTMSVLIKYENDVQVTYTLNAYMPYEGQRIIFNGTLGRIEMRNWHRQPWEVDCAAELRVTRDGKDDNLIKIPYEAGEHGGSDTRIRDHIFIPGKPDPLMQKAGSRAGLMSSLIGIAAYTSIEEKERIAINDLVTW